jgi:hypothetical protein
MMSGAELCRRFGYSDLKEAALPEEPRMGFECCVAASGARVQWASGVVCTTVMMQ